MWRKKAFDERRPPAGPPITQKKFVNRHRMALFRFTSEFDLYTNGISK